MFNHARLKLTLWYLLIIMLISISFSFFIYRFATSEINRVLRMEKLRQQGLYAPRHIIIPFQFNEPVNMMITPPNPEVLEEAKQRILVVLISIDLAILGLSGALGYFLAGKTLRPIKEMVDEQNRFITDASHEFRTPLTSLKSEIEVNLRDKKLNLKQAKKLLISNLEEVNNLQYISDNLIKLAQFQKTSDQIIFEIVSIQEIVNQAIKKVQKLAIKKNIKINNSVSDISISGNFQSLTELLVILLDNAIKYSSKNSEVFLSSKKLDTIVQVIIQDQGTGISKEDLPFLFDRFYRADQSRTKINADGFGLGLSIAKQIVDKHSGSIEVKSRIDQGTTFTIRLPLNH